MSPWMFNGNNGQSQTSFCLESRHDFTEETLATMLSEFRIQYSIHAEYKYRHFIYQQISFISVSHLHLNKNFTTQIHVYLFSEVLLRAFFYALSSIIFSPQPHIGWQVFPVFFISLPFYYSSPFPSFIFVNINITTTTFCFFIVFSRLMTDLLNEVFSTALI
jgi:hypothetical protein